MKKDVRFKSDKDWLTTFSSIGVYLIKPHVLTSSIKWNPLGLYIPALKHSLITLLAQENAEGKENTINTSAKHLWVQMCNTSPSKKCLALTFAIQKLWHSPN